MFHLASAQPSANSEWIQKKIMPFFVFEWQKCSDSHQWKWPYQLFEVIAISAAGLWDLYFVSFFLFSYCSVIKKYKLYQMQSRMYFEFVETNSNGGRWAKNDKGFCETEHKQNAMVKRSFVFWLSMIIEARKDGINDGIV